MTHTSNQNTLTLGNLLGDKRVLIATFIALRLILFIALQPYYLDDVERGIGTNGDRLYHYALSSLASEDLYPFRDWWSEFPPIWYITTTTAYVILGEDATYDKWSLILGMLMLASETGVMLVLMRLGTHLHNPNTGMALAWVYSVLALPLIFMWWNFDSLVTLTALMGLYFILKRSDIPAAVWIAIGALTKFVPLLIFGAVIRFMRPVRMARFIVIALGVVILAYLPFFAINAEFTSISLTAQFGKPSYQTVWALIDGNYATGNFGSIESHFYAEGVDEDPFERQPAVVPSWLRLLIAAGIGAWVFLRTQRRDAIGVTAFFGITLLIFYLQSQGFSPQWLTLIIPLVLLVHPNRNGVYMALMLSLLAFIEYPLIFSRTGETGGLVTPESSMFMLWVIVVVVRTLLLAGIAFSFYTKLRQQPDPRIAYTP
jgi:hypothetical protein